MRGQVHLCGDIVRNKMRYTKYLTEHFCLTKIRKQKMETNKGQVFMLFWMYEKEINKKKNVMNIL